MEEMTLAKESAPSEFPGSWPVGNLSFISFIL